MFLASNDVIVNCSKNNEEDDIVDVITIDDDSGSSICSAKYDNEFCDNDELDVNILLLRRKALRSMTSVNESEAKDLEEEMMDLLEEADEAASDTQPQTSDFNNIIQNITPHLSYFGDQSAGVEVPTVVKKLRLNAVQKSNTACNSFTNISVRTVDCINNFDSNSNSGKQFIDDMAVTKKRTTFYDNDPMDIVSEDEAEERFFYDQQAKASLEECPPCIPVLTPSNPIESDIQRCRVINTANKNNLIQVSSLKSMDDDSTSLVPKEEDNEDVLRSIVLQSIVNRRQLEEKNIKTMATSYVAEAASTLCDVAKKGKSMKEKNLTNQFNTRCLDEATIKKHFPNSCSPFIIKMDESNTSSYPEDQDYNDNGGMSNGIDFKESLDLFLHEVRSVTSAPKPKKLPPPKPIRKYPPGVCDNLNPKKANIYSSQPEDTRRNVPNLSMSKQIEYQDPMGCQPANTTSPILSICLTETGTKASGDLDVDSVDLMRQELLASMKSNSKSLPIGTSNVIDPKVLNRQKFLNSMDSNQSTDEVVIQRDLLRLEKTSVEAEARCQIFNPKDDLMAPPSAVKNETSSALIPDLKVTVFHGNRDVLINHQRHKLKEKSRKEQQLDLVRMEAELETLGKKIIIDKNNLPDEVAKLKKEETDLREATEIVRQLKQKLSLSIKLAHEKKRSVLRRRISLKQYSRQLLKDRNRFKDLGGECIKLGCEQIGSDYTCPIDIKSSQFYWKDEPSKVEVAAPVNGGNVLSSVSSSLAHIRPKSTKTVGLSSQVQPPLNPHLQLCPFQLDGTCLDSSCSFQHINNK